MLSPLRLLLLVALGAWLGHRRGWRRLRWGWTVAAALLLVLTTPLGANALVALQEARAPAAAACAGPPPQAIVLLSAGVTRRPQDERDYAVLDLASLQRLLGAVELQRAHAALPLLIVGSSGWRIANSTLMASLARDLGIDATLLRVETRSRTTWQNAQDSARLQPPLPQRIWLVTSRLHMPRALFAFRAAGFEPCAWPVDSRYEGFRGLGYLLPSGSATVKAEQALHELVGEAAYRLRAALGGTAATPRA